MNNKKIKKLNDKKIIFYTLYKKKDNEDLEIIKQFDKLEEITEYLKIDKNYLKQIISRNNFYKDIFLIKKDTILLNEL